MDIVIPIVFPDYLIAVNTPRTKVDIFPWVDIDNFWIRLWRGRAKATHQYK